ncbi:MAG: hypothetical protein GTO24_19850 [candidate division Zixibacteria bacterium]|nr:hypothetical protein [candidate division Zixibacteria bacterium]
MLTELSRKSININNVAKRALEDKAALSELLEGVLSKKEKIRFNCFKVLLFISEQHPKVLYPKWDFFATLLDSDNTYLKYIAIYVIANLAVDDPRGRFEKIFNKYYGLLDDESVIPPSHVAANSAKIARAKPKLQTRITNRLLDIDRTGHRLERKDLIKGYVIEAFGRYFQEAKNKRRMLEFVRAQLNSKSPRTKKRAKEFLKEWEK